MTSNGRLILFIHCISELLLDTYLVSLGKNPRNESLIDDLIAYDFNPIKIGGFDLRDSGLVDIRKHINKEVFLGSIGRFPTGGELGCALSHVTFIRDIAASNSEWALVLEDDAVISENFRIVKNLIEVLPNDVPIVVSLFSSPFAPFRRKTLEKVKESDNYFLGEYYLPPPHTVAYIINRKAANLALCESKISGLADWPLWALKAKFYGTFPNLVEHMDISKSYLEQDREIYRHVISNSFVTNLRRRLFFLNPSVFRNCKNTFPNIKDYYFFVVFKFMLFYSRRPFQSTIYFKNQFKLIR